MLIAFKLSMPRNNSLNGKWSGEDRIYCRIKNIRSKKSIDRILAQKSYGYDFGDGWYASVSVEEVDASEARRLRKLSDGFCGYDWMINSIVLRGEIRVGPKPAAVSQ